MYDSKRPIPKYKKKPPKKTEQYGFTSQMEMFQYLIYYAPRPIICPVSKENITKLFDKDPEVWVHCCMHVLPKGKYRRWKLNPANMLLVLPEVHHLYDAGTEIQRQGKKGWNWNYLYELSDKLKHDYEEEYKREKSPLYDPSQMDTADTDGEAPGEERDS